jgi:hypothetical protein
MFEDYITGENYTMMLDSFFFPQLNKRMQLDLTLLQRSWNSCTPSSSIA